VGDYLPQLKLRNFLAISESLHAYGKMDNVEKLEEAGIDACCLE
jgi:hypothetical protein